MKHEKVAREIIERFAQFFCGGQSHDDFRDAHIGDVLPILKRAYGQGEQRWQAISSAPKDQSYILLFFGNGYRDNEGNLMSVGFWSDRKNTWWLDALTGGGVADHEPTHWMPLPIPQRGPLWRNEMSKETIEHGPQAYYSSDGERYCPVIDCLCGWEMTRQSNWEEAGHLFDQHLAEVFNVQHP